MRRISRLLRNKNRRRPVAKENMSPTCGTDAARQAFAPAMEPTLERARGLLRSLAGDPPQVLLLEGGDEAQRQAMARWWAALLHRTCGDGQGPCRACPECLRIGAGLHLDVLAYDGRISNKEDEENPGPVRALSMDNVRALKARLGDSVHGQGPRVVILSGMDGARDAAANALLKVLEEPSPTTVFALLAPQRGQLLPTLVSRSWTLTLPWPSPLRPEPGMRPWEAALADFIERGQGWWHLTSAKGAVDQEQAQRVVLACQKALMAAMGGIEEYGPLTRRFAALPPQGRMAASRLLEEAQEALQYSVSPPRVLDWLAVRLVVLSRQDA